jgi:hypothetical protein
MSRTGGFYPIFLRIQSPHAEIREVGLGENGKIFRF